MLHILFAAALFVCAVCAFPFAALAQIVALKPTSKAAPVRGLDPAKNLTDCVQQTWTQDNGLPQNSASALCQTRDGYVWLGTQEGLVRFDGSRYVVFDKRNTPGFGKNNYVLVLLEDRTGTLWIGTYGGGVSRYKDGRFTSFTTKDGLVHDVVCSLLEDRTGAIWMGTRGGGVSRYKDGRFTTFTGKDGLVNDIVYSLLEDRSGAIWMGTRGGGVSCYKDGRFTRFTTKDGLMNDIVYSLLEDRTGAIWMGTGGGVSCYKDGRFTMFISKDGLPNDGIHALLEDHAGAIWIGTFSSGVSRYKDGRFTTFTIKDGLANNGIRSLLEDHTGGIWIGTEGGVNRYKEGRFRAFTTKDGLANDGVLSLLEDRTNAIWMGTFGGGVSCYKDSRFITFTTKNGFANDRVYSLLEDREGAIWIGTGGGVSRYKDGRFTTFTTKEGLANNGVRSLLEDRTGAIWMGTYGGVSRYKDGRFTTFTTKDGLAYDFVLSLLEDRTGAIWVGMRGGGVSRYKDGRFTTFSTKDGLAGDVVYSLLEDHEGAIWIGTEGGLSRYKAGHFTSFTVQDGLFDDVAFCILEDNLGYFWMSCNKGIYRVRKRDLEDFAEGKLKHIPCQNFGVADGMKSAECSAGNPSGWRDHLGRLWFATLKGAVVIDPRKVETEVPTVILEEMLVDKANILFGTSISKELPASTEKLEFHYTAPVFTAPERVHFMYMLEGYDQEWVEAGAQRVAYYTNLPGGRAYRFRVKAAHEGAWNEAGAGVEFRIAPQFWETWWFIGLCIVAVGGGMYQGVRWRTWRLRARAQRLEGMVAERTRELQHSNAALHQANEEIARQMEVQTEQTREIELAGAALQERNIALETFDREKNEFLGIAAHDLKNPLSAMSMTVSMLQLNRKKMTDDMQHEYLSRILIVIDRMTAIITNLLDINALERGGKQFHSELVDLAPMIVGVVKDYEEQAATKNIRVETHIPPNCVVRTDRSAIAQVFENLLSNAIKYSPHGKNVFVRMKFEEGNMEQEEEAVSSLIPLSVALNSVPLNTSSFLRIEVEDEGPGISEEDMQKLFGKFTRLSARPTGGEHSTGLGLSIVKKMVEAMNGRVWCESELGKGATFIVELLLAKS